MDDVAPWLKKRAEGEKCFSVKFSTEQHTELKIIASSYESTCWQHERYVTGYPIYFQLSEDEQGPQFFEDGFCPVMDAQPWQNYLDQKSPFISALSSIIVHLCAAQIAIVDRLKQPGHHYGPEMMLPEESKKWATEFSSVRVTKDAQLKEKLNTRKLFLTKIITTDKVLKKFPECTDALSKCITIIDTEMMPCLKAMLAQQDVLDAFPAFKKTSRLLFKHLILFMFHVFRNTRCQESECEISDLQDPIFRDRSSIGKECDATSFGQLLLKLINASELCEVFLDDSSRDERCLLLCQNGFVSDEGTVKTLKELLPSSRRNLVDSSPGILLFFEKDQEVMQQFVYLHALTQKMALFFVIFQMFSSLELDCRNVLKEMREVIQHYKFLHQRWVESIQYVYINAERHLSRVKHSKSSGEIENWKNHFAVARNNYTNLEENLASMNNGVHDLERMLCNIKPVTPLKNAKKSLEKLVALMESFKREIKPTLSQGESRALLMSSPSKNSGGTASVLSATTPKGK